MSPFRTLSSCGNSSTLLRRRKRPSGVIRTLSGMDFPAESSRSLMVLNLSNVNGFARRPGRLSRKRMGRPMLTQMPRATSASSGQEKKRAPAEPTTSRILLDLGNILAADHDDVPWALDPPADNLALRARGASG